MLLYLSPKCSSSTRQYPERAQQQAKAKVDAEAAQAAKQLGQEALRRRLEDNMNKEGRFQDVFPVLEFWGDDL